MNIEDRILGLIGISTKARKITFGTDAVLERVIKKKTSLVVIAKDASEKSKENMKFICKKNKVRIIEFSTIDKISHAMGKKNKSVICINDKNMGEEIYKIICGGEAIG